MGKGFCFRERLCGGWEESTLCYHTYRVWCHQVVLDVCCCAFHIYLDPPLHPTRPFSLRPPMGAPSPLPFTPRPLLFPSLPLPLFHPHASLLEQIKDPRIHVLPRGSQRVRAVQETVTSLVHEVLLAKVRGAAGQGERGCWPR